MSSFVPVVLTQRARQQQPLRERNREDIVDVDAHSECIDLTNEEDGGFIDLTSPRQHSINDASAIVVDARDTGNSSSSRRRRRNRQRLRDIENRMGCLHMANNILMEDDLPTPDRGNTPEPVRITDSPEPPLILGNSPEQALTIDYTPERPSAVRRNLDPSCCGSNSTSTVNSPGIRGITCPICMDDYKEIRENGVQLMSTVCGHLFCASCIQAVIRTNRECPTCRKRLTLKQIHPVFF